MINKLKSPVYTSRSGAPISRAKVSLIRPRVGQLTGPQAGPSASQLTGPQAGPSAGQLTGPQAGPRTRQLTGPQAGSPASQFTGPQAGSRASQCTGPPGLRSTDRKRPAAQQCRINTRWSRVVDVDEVAEYVIDLGAPRPAPRLSARSAPRLSALPPSPRLYPGPKPRPQARRTAGAGRARRVKRTLLRVVPNSRLYRPGPPRARRASPPPARPRAAWPPPAPPRPLDTASHAALRLGARSPSPPARTPQAQRLVVTLPEAAARYRPTSAHFRARVAPGSSSGTSTPPAAAPRALHAAMEPAARHSASPEDRSEGNESLSAPSEFLAEFLSAIMRRQYEEALKYCRLILQYEPHNSTARGFYPLLRHKVARAQRTEAAAAAADCGDQSSGDETSTSAAGQHCAGGSCLPSRQHGRAAHCGVARRMLLTADRADGPAQEELMQHSADSEGESTASAAGEHSDLELDSSASASPSRSRRTDDSASAGAGGGWDSAGSASRSEADCNGNAAPHAHLLQDDLENDNVAGGGEPHTSTRLKHESAGSSLQRLRAHFACSIK